MIKRISIISVTLLIAVVFTSPAFAELNGNEKKGKFLYRKIYKTCHERGVVDTKKPPVNPDAKTKAQWERLYNKRDFSEMGCPEEWAKLSDEEILNIFTYLQTYAADSPTPAKCR